MRLTFRETDDKLKYEIELNGLYLGHVKMDV